MNFIKIKKNIIIITYIASYYNTSSIKFLQDTHSRYTFYTEVRRGVLAHPQKPWVPFPGILSIKSNSR